MARKHRSRNLETRTARLKLAARGKPYSGPLLARGLKLNYRRNRTGNGSWTVKVANGSGGHWTRAIGLADDHDESNGKTILTFFEVQDVAKKLVRGGDEDDAAPVTVDGALKDYARDLTARQANVYNAEWPRLHLTAARSVLPRSTG